MEKKKKWKIYKSLRCQHQNVIQDTCEDSLSLMEKLSIERSLDAWDELKCKINHKQIYISLLLAAGNFIFMIYLFVF